MNNLKVMSEKEVTTNKEHQCIDCGKFYPTNTKMDYVTYRYDNRFISVHHCHFCRL